MITGETLIKGLFYFMLKARGGKFLSKKQVAGKDGKLKWVYKYAKKKGEKSKASPEKQVKQSKPKADKKGMNEHQTHAKEMGEKLDSLLSKIQPSDLPENKHKYYSDLVKESKKVSPENAKNLSDFLSEVTNKLSGEQKKPVIWNVNNPKEKKEKENKIEQLNRNFGFKKVK